MGQVLIRNLDDDVIADYRRHAADRGRSLEAELRDALTAGRPKRRLSAAEKLALSARMRALTPPAAAVVDSTAFIREERDAD